MKIDHTESFQVDVDEKKVTIRPIKKEDIELECEFIKKLSPETKHYRFLGGVRELTSKQIRQLCDIDFDHSMAFIASINSNGKEEEIGVSRYAVAADSDNYEFAVTIADEWRNKGIDKILMQTLIDFSKKHQVKKLYSINMADDDDMRQLADSMNMKSDRDPDDSHQIIYSLTL